MNQIIKEALRTWLRRAHHAKDTRQWTVLRECKRVIRRIWKLRHLTNKQAIYRLQGV